MKNYVLKFIIYAAILVFIIRYIEKRSIYFPTKGIETDPSVLGLTFKEVFFKTQDNIILNGWFIRNSKADNTVLFCHGNGGNISHRLEKISIFYNMGLNIFIFDYRGYGKSQGSPSERGLYKDAQAAYNYLIEEFKVPRESIVLYGESLGGAVAIELASRFNAKALITEDTFSSVKDMVKIIYPFMPAFILGSRYDSISKIKDVDIPKLIIHSVDDEIVPYRLGERLFEAAKEPKEFLKIRGSHNNAFWDSEETYKNGIKSFLKFRE